MIETWKDFFIVVSSIAVFFTVSRIVYIYFTVRNAVDTSDWVERLQRGEELHSGNLFEQGKE